MGKRSLLSLALTTSLLGAELIITGIIANVYELSVTGLAVSVVSLFTFKIIWNQQKQSGKNF